MGFLNNYQKFYKILFYKIVLIKMNSIFISSNLFMDKIFGDRIRLNKIKFLNLSLIYPFDQLNSKSYILFLELYFRRQEVTVLRIRIMSPRFLTT